jgi:hypothetical protein
MFDYDNIGRKIKGAAEFIFILEAIVTIIVGIALMILELPFLGILLMVLGPVLAWISSWLMYGFGQLIENSDIIVSECKGKKPEKKNVKEFQTKAINTKENKAKEIVEEKEHSDEKVVKHTGTIQEILKNPNVYDYEFIDMICPNCKEELAYTKEYLKQGNVVCPMCDAHISI